MTVPLRQVYVVSQPSGTTRHTGRDFDAAGAVTGALTTTTLSGDRTGWFTCHTVAVPDELVDVTDCLVPGNPAWAQLGDIVTNMLAGAHTHGGRRPRTLSGAHLATEAQRILQTRDYTPFLFAVDGIPVSGVRFNSSPVAAGKAADLFLLVHERHLVAIESHDGAGFPRALVTDQNVAP